jgi:hypothetical protein
MTRLRKGSKRLDGSAPRMSREQLIAALDALCDKLRKPLPVSEVDAGWNAPRVASYLEMFQRMRNDIAAKVAIPYMPIVKTLDHSGITSGELLEDASQIDVALNEREW